MAFTHLHVHTEYSLLDGSSKIRELTARAKELGMDSMAITDHERCRDRPRRYVRRHRLLPGCQGSGDQTHPWL